MWENTRGLFLFPAYFWQKWAIEATWAKTLPQIKNQQGENGNLVDLWTGTGSLGKNAFFSISSIQFLHFLFAKKRCGGLFNQNNWRLKKGWRGEEGKRKNNQLQTILARRISVKKWQQNAREFLLYPILPCSNLTDFLIR